MSEKQKTVVRVHEIKQWAYLEVRYSVDGEVDWHDLDPGPMFPDEVDGAFRRWDDDEELAAELGLALGREVELIREDK